MLKGEAIQGFKILSGLLRYARNDGLLHKKVRMNSYTVSKLIKWIAFILVSIIVVTNVYPIIMDYREKMQIAEDNGIARNIGSSTRVILQSLNIKAESLENPFILESVKFELRRMIDISDLQVTAGKDLIETKGNHIHFHISDYGTVYIHWKKGSYVLT